MRKYIIVVAAGLIGLVPAAGVAATEATGDYRCGARAVHSEPGFRRVGSSDDDPQPGRHHSRRRAAIVGAVVGAGIGLFTANFADCPDAAKSCPGARAAYFLLTTATGAGIGIGIDALFDDVRTRRASGSPVTPSGVRRGLRIAVRW